MAWFDHLHTILQLVFQYLDMNTSLTIIMTVVTLITCLATARQWLQVL